MSSDVDRRRRRSDGEPGPTKRGRQPAVSRYSGFASKNHDRADTEVPAVAFEHVSLAFDDNVGLRDVSFAVRAGRMSILLGGSGTGKSVVLKLILSLLKPDSGIIRINGERIDTMTEGQLMTVRDGIECCSRRARYSIP